MVKALVQALNNCLSIVLRPIGAIGIDNDVKKLSSRIIVLFICFFGTMIYWSYCAVLTSHLTVSSTKLTINNLEDLLGQRQYTLYYLEGSAGYSYFSRATERENRVAFLVFQEYAGGKGIR